MKGEISLKAFNPRKHDSFMSDYLYNKRKFYLDFLKNFFHYFFFFSFRLILIITMTILTLSAASLLLSFVLEILVKP